MVSNKDKNKQNFKLYTYSFVRTNKWNGTDIRVLTDESDSYKLKKKQLFSIKFI